ncbi:hypothetical protein [Hoeflea sp.]|uniref:hypothetical protein n=1 Tax=Hoeflea sp. TaxID=1940281 RepID=UPI0031B8A01A
MHHRSWRPSRIIEKGSEHPQRSELDCNAQTIVITTVHGDKNAIGVVEMEVAGKLI